MGNVPDWFVAGGTILAFGGTVWIINRDSRTRRRKQDEEVWDEALNVTIEKPAVWEWTQPNAVVVKELDVSVSNGGRRGIRDVQVLLLGTPVQDNKRTIKEVSPGGSEPLKPRFPWSAGVFDANGFVGFVEINFYDAAGIHWYKTSYGHLYRDRLGSRGGKRADSSSASSFTKWTAPLYGDGLAFWQPATKNAGRSSQSNG